MQNIHEKTCVNPCNVCGGREVSVLATRSRSGKRLRTVICSDCGLVWSDPFPHNPRSFYQDHYRVAYKGTYAPKLKHIFRAAKVALSRHKILNKWMVQPKKILDVGTGGGEFAYLLKSLGHDVKGIEPNQGYAEYSKQEYGLDIHVGFIQDIQQVDESYDLITIWHVLEHTENPTDVLTRLHRLLKHEGILVVEVPTIEATCQSPKNTFHEAHIYNFNLETLRKLGEKVGFSEQEHHVSPGGANITLVLQKLTNHTQRLAEKTLTIPGNSARIIDIVTHHTDFKHYLSAEPYRRFLNRISNIISEQCATVNFVSGKHLLDRLYA